MTQPADRVAFLRAADRTVLVVRTRLVSDADAADACRADAFASRMLGEVAADGEITWGADAPRVEVQVVMDLDTLRGETDTSCLLDGMPVPADLGREIAGYATAFRRMVTEPVTGHLLDYGRLVYLPEPLRTYVLARDGGCRTPGCTNRAMSRLQMDHADTFPEGASDSGNTGGLCITCHQLTTAGYVEIRQSRADGSCTWRTAWGQSVRIPPRSYLPGLDDPPPEPPPPEEPPPFSRRIRRLAGRGTGDLVPAHAVDPAVAWARR